MKTTTIIHHSRRFVLNSNCRNPLPNDRFRIANPRNGGVNGVRNNEFRKVCTAKTQQFSPCQPIPRHSLMKNNNQAKIIIPPHHAFSSRVYVTGNLAAPRIASPEVSTNFAKRMQSSIVAAVPAITKLVESNLLLNAGAVLSLTGFMMSDEFHLRFLSMCGSISGVLFNLTRKPPAHAAACWGGVFITVNAYHLHNLYLERMQEVKFTNDEMMLYTNHFKDYNVEPWQFKKLIQCGGCRFSKYKKGEVIVEDGKPLNDVMMVVKGEVGAEDPQYDTLTRPFKYTYHGDGKHGCVIGGTALIDPSVKGKNYPHRLVVAESDTVVVKWDTEKLKELMESDTDIESAFLQSLYFELIQSLRRHRTAEEVKKDRRNRLQRRSAKRSNAQMMSDSLNEFELIVQRAINNARVYEEDSTTASGKGMSVHYLELKSSDKRYARLFATENRINKHQSECVLSKFGWTTQEWEDGGKALD